MAKLRRLNDGAGDEGACSEAIKWNEDGTKDKVVSDRPTIDCSMLVGSFRARTYGSDYWLTTVVTEILEEKTLDNGQLYVKFKTGNSLYEWWS